MYLTPGTNLCSIQNHTTTNTFIPIVKRIYYKRESSHGWTPHIMVYRCTTTLHKIPKPLDRTVSNCIFIWIVEYCGVNPSGITTKSDGHAKRHDWNPLKQKSYLYFFIHWINIIKFFNLFDTIKNKLRIIYIRIGNVF